MAFANQVDGSLVETQTSDGLRLHGFFQQSRTNSSEVATACEKSLGKECWLVVHGVAGNFYNSSLLSSIALNLLSCHCDVLRINTRGRDAVSYFAVGAANSRCGAAYEMVSDGALDIAAWVSVLLDEGYQRINLLGHSLGAVKCIYYLAEHFDKAAASTISVDHINRLVLLSPPRLQAEILRTDIKYAAAYEENLDEAKRLCEMGKPEALLTIRYPQPMIVSAATYWDKYGLESRYDYHRFIEKIKCETLWCFGEHEVRGPRASFRGVDQTLIGRFEALEMPNHIVKVIPNGDHAYTGARKLLCQTVMDWAKAAV